MEILSLLLFATLRTQIFRTFDFLLLHIGAYDDFRKLHRNGWLARTHTGMFSSSSTVMGYRGGHGLDRRILKDHIRRQFIVRGYPFAQSCQDGIEFGIRGTSRTAFTIGSSSSSAKSPSSTILNDLGCFKNARPLSVIRVCHNSLCTFDISFEYCLADHWVEMLGIGTFGRAEHFQPVVAYDLMSEFLSLPNIMSIIYSVLNFSLSAAIVSGPLTNHLSLPLFLVLRQLSQFPQFSSS